MAEKSTVATLNVRLEILEALLAKQADVIGGLYDAITKLEARPAPAVRATPDRDTTVASVTLTKAERVRRIAILQAQYPQARSFTPEQLMQVA